jgi:hypothetical protein
MSEEVRASEQATVDGFEALLSGKPIPQPEESTPEPEEETPQQHLEEDVQEEAEEVVEEDQELLYVVKIDGEEVEVPLSELQQGYSRNADYTRKTQALSAQRKELESLQQDYAQRVNALNTFAYQLQQEPSIPEPEIDWERLQHADPVEWLKQRQLAQDRANIRSQRAAQLEAVKQEQQQIQQQQFNETLQKERELLNEVIPSWRDPEVAKQEKSEIRDFAKSHYGLTDSDLQSAYDHRLVRILYDAYSANKSLAQGKQAIKEAQEPTVKTARVRGRSPQGPTTRRQTNFNKAMGRLEKSGSTEDATAAFAALLGN